MLFHIFKLRFSGVEILEHLTNKHTLISPKNEKFIYFLYQDSLISYRVLVSSKIIFFDQYIIRV